MCRECIREDGWDKRIKLLRVKDHFICTFSSASATLSLQPSVARLTNPCFPPVPHTISLDRIDGNPSAQRALRGGRKGLHGQVPHRPHRTRQPPRPVKHPFAPRAETNNFFTIYFTGHFFFPYFKIRQKPDGWLRTFSVNTAAGLVRRAGRDSSSARA
jgi:hypothetical protein